MVAMTTVWQSMVSMTIHCSLEIRVVSLPISERALIHASTWYFCDPDNHEHWDTRKAPRNNLTNTGWRDWRNKHNMSTVNTVIFNNELVSVCCARHSVPCALLWYLGSHILLLKVLEYTCPWVHLACPTLPSQGHHYGNKWPSYFYNDTLIVVLASEKGELKKNVMRFMIVSVTYFSNMVSIWIRSTELHTCKYTNKHSDLNSVSNKVIIIIIIMHINFTDSKMF